ncbi:MAG: sigma-70 family RNA polymerase sigma factor [Thermomicrobiales bacterium]|nr:sigma-70 family RNA polymerase sigma factor [Thermomicrobiales bacterium]
MDRDSRHDRSDDDVVRRALRNRADFAPLYERHAAAIYGYCYNHTRDPELANDLAAQIFLRAIERLGQYQPRAHASFRSWLFAIARNIVIDHWRRFRPTWPIEPWQIAAIADEPGPEEITLHRARMADLLDALDQLPERQRTIVEFRLAGMTTPEIASALGLTESAVKSAQTRAYRHLRELLGVQNESDYGRLPAAD